MYHSYVKTFYLDELALLSTTGLLFSLRMPKVELKSGRRRRGGQPQARAAGVEPGRYHHHPGGAVAAGLPAGPKRGLGKTFPGLR